MTDFSSFLEEEIQHSNKKQSFTYQLKSKTARAFLKLITTNHFNQIYHKFIRQLSHWTQVYLHLKVNILPSIVDQHGAVLIEIYV